MALATNLGMACEKPAADPAAARELVAAVRQVAGGGTVLNPKVISPLVARRRREADELCFVASTRSTKAETALSTRPMS